MSKLGRINIRDAEYKIDDASGQNVFHVKDPHALVQAAGYLKHISATENKEGIFFRGQSKIYGSLIPSLFRGCTNPATNATRRIGVLNKFINEVRSRSKILNKSNEIVHEPLLQHYGVGTTWIDIVDNIWIALWFSCHKAKYTGKYGQYLHFEKRNIFEKTSSDEFAYILLIGAGVKSMDQYVPGLYRSEQTEFIDLRMAAPSIFLRPHAQHGLLFRKRGNTKYRPIDYADSIRGVIRVDLVDAIKWLGEGSLLSTHSLFPPPVYDQGYKYLLMGGIEGNATIGAISHIGA